MKKLTLFLLTILSYSFLVAQTFPVSVSGTVRNLDGTPTEGVNIFVRTDSLLVDFEYFDQTITAADGTYHFNFDVPNANSQGSLLVSMENCNNNFEFEELSWFPTNTDLTTDFTYCVPICGVSITAESNPTGGGDVTALTAISSGVAPFLYEWDTGETAASILPTATRTYCVTLTDAIGCMADICTFHFYDSGEDTICSVNITRSPNGTSLQAIASGHVPFTYLWDNGSTQSSITPSAPILHCVTIVDGVGCVSEACDDFSIPTPIYRIQGHVLPSDSTNLNSNLEDIIGSVYLIVHDEEQGTLTAIDTTQIQSLGTYYSFGNVPAGDYLVKATFAEESNLYENNLPTYYGHSLWWHEATTITIPYTGGWDSFDITMMEGQNLGGPGFIGGLISEGANFDGQVVEERSGNPLTGVSVLLLTESDEPITHTVSNETGEFDFPNVAWGTYKVYLEIAGLEQVFHMVTINPDQPEVTNLTFEVGEEGVLNVSSFLTAKALQVFPNPTQDEFVVNFNSPQTFEANINMTNLHGQTVWSQVKTIQADGQQIDCSMTNLPKGVYFLNVQTGKAVISKKIVKL